MENITKLIEEYANKSSVDFQGNDEVEAFYGHVVDFFEDTDGSIVVTLRDMEDNYFDISWNEVKDEEFDFDE